MQLSDHSLRQFDEDYLNQLEEEALRALSVKLLVDLKEARERLNQDSHNSSRPPGSDAPWGGKPSDGGALAKKGVGPEEETAHQDGATLQEAPQESVAPEGSRPDAGEAVAAPQKPEPKSAGKVKGAPGYGRVAPVRVDATEIHAPCLCAGCGASLADAGQTAYTGYYEADWVRTETGWEVRHTKHLYQEATCPCGHQTRAEPHRHLEDGVALGGFRLVGPGLATLIVALSLRYRLGRARIREFLGDWLDVWLSVGAIHEAIAEAGLVVAPVEAELIEAIQQSQLLHADETPWPEQRSAPANLWLWVFITGHTVLYRVGNRGQGLVRELLADYTGMLMSDGWQAYRWLEKRLRCWAHLKRKAVGLSESLDPEAQAFGLDVLGLWQALWQAVQEARQNGPPGSPLRDAWGGRLEDFRNRCGSMRDCPHTKTRELAREFLNDWDAIFAVLDNPLWPLTNNEAERALRHWVILRQLSHGTRTRQGSRGLALLASVIDTCRQRGHSPWDYLQQAIARRRQNLDLLPLPV